MNTLLQDTLEYKGRDPYNNPMRVLARKVWEEVGTEPAKLAIVHDRVEAKLTGEATEMGKGLEEGGRLVERAMSIYRGAINTARFNEQKAAEERRLLMLRLSGKKEPKRKRREWAEGLDEDAAEDEEEFLPGPFTASQIEQGDVEFDESREG